MDPVKRQYEAYPYPERDPAEEAGRLIIGSPSHPFEIDHFLFAGARDWSQPFRVLVAGGGTGDGLIMLAQVLADCQVNAEIVYLDMSTASRAIAEARAAARGLTNIRFETADLLNAAEYGLFDYIDCCGVLHHLPDPDAGFAALRAALAEGGGMGAMVYAPYGREGVYQMQDALRTLVGEDDPETQVARAKVVFEALPPTNGLKRNPFVHDHLEGGDAGFYDLLLHSRDRAYDVPALFDAVDRADMRLLSFTSPGRYDPRMMLRDPILRERVVALPYREQAAVAERLSGNMKVHNFYAVAKGAEAGRIAMPGPEAVPCIIGASPAALAESIHKSGGIRGEFDGLAFQRALPPETAGIVMNMDGKRSVDDIRAMLGWRNDKFEPLFANLYQPLNNFGLLRFSGLQRRMGMS